MSLLRRYREWREARQFLKDKHAYQRGFSWALTEYLLEGTRYEDIVPKAEADNSEFCQGAKAACNVLEEHFNEIHPMAIAYDREEFDQPFF